MLFEAWSIGDLETLQHLTALAQSNNFRGEVSGVTRKWVQIEQNPPRNIASYLGPHFSTSSELSQ